MADLLAQVEHEILTRRLLRPRQKVLVAVSGGLDSMILLHALLALAGKFHWRISVAHFNHHLRGTASRADERLVRNFAERHYLPFYFGEAQVKKLAKETGASLEMAARKVRHEFLAVTARAQKIPTVALAHQADDQVELFFLRLFRGEGVAGMRWQSRSVVDGRVGVVRPLLGLNKVELAEYAGREGVPFREDATNFSADIPRNRIRQELIPFLTKRFQPELTVMILRFREIAGAEADLAILTAQRWLAEGGAAFGELALAVQRRVIQLQLNDLKVLVDFDRVESLRLLADTPVSVGSHLSIVRDAQGKLARHRVSAMEFNGGRQEFELMGGEGEEIFGATRFIWKKMRVRPGFSLGKRADGEFFDAEKVGKTVLLRHWQAGDRFQPMGMKTAVKLQDLFTNARIPRAERHEKVVAVGMDGGIFWVEGLRLGEGVKVGAQTRRILNWRWVKISLK